MSSTFYISPKGEFQHPWVNRADTKYNDAGLYHTKLAATDKPQTIEAFKEKVEAAAKAALAEHTDEMSPGEKKKWSLYVPFEAEEDDAGNPTGRTVFVFKQNAKIELKDGSTKDISIEIRDAKDNIVDVPVFGGSVGRVMCTMRPIVMSSAKQVGVRLDFFKVQVIKLAERRGAGFGAVDDEDAFVGDGSQAGFGGSDDDEQGGEY